MRRGLATLPTDHAGAVNSLGYALLPACDFVTSWLNQCPGCKRDYVKTANLFCVADVKHTARISLNSNGIARSARAKIEPSVVQVGDPPDVVLGLGVVRHAGTARYCSRTRVIGGQGQLDIAAIAFQKFLQVADAAVHI